MYEYKSDINVNNRNIYRNVEIVSVNKSNGNIEDIDENRLSSSNVIDNQIDNVNINIPNGSLIHLMVS